MKIAEFKKILSSADTSAIKDGGLVLLQLHATFGEPIDRVRQDHKTLILQAADKSLATNPTTRKLQGVLASDFIHWFNSLRANDYSDILFKKNGNTYDRILKVVAGRLKDEGDLDLIIDRKSKLTED